MSRKPPRNHLLRRMPACEPLESRLALSGSASALMNAGGLTLSFAPDGTKVQDQHSSLTATLATKAGIAPWQATIARAFQTWAQYANVNIGIVPDGGQPLGIQGPTHSDPRFGDIRVAGVPLSPDTTGEAIGERRTIAGSWAGDVVFNMDATWPDAAKLYQVALHEAGHSFGLAHSTDPNSPMFAHTGEPTSGPTADDIANLEAIYGARRPDVFEGSNNNDVIARAARIPHSEPVDGFDGTTPLVVYGDIHDAADKDVFLLPVLPGYQGPLTFQLWTSGISLLQGKISVLDQNGNVLATTQSASELGDVLTVQLPAATAAKYYIRIEPATPDVFATGAYGLVVKYDQLITTGSAAIKQAVLQGHQWQAATDDSAAEVDIRNLLTSGTPQLANDQHLDDTIDGAKALTPVFDTSAVRRFQFVGTISDATDLDVYRLRSQSAFSAARGLTIAVENMEDNGLVPQITILDKAGTTLPTSLIANGNGLVMIRAANIVANQDYFVRISGSSGTGNYEVTARFDDDAATRTLLTSGAIGPDQPARLANLYVARPQLFSFALASQPTPGTQGPQTVWATVYDDKHRTVAFLGEAVGDFRSANSVLLAPGTYHIRIEGRDTTGSTAASASYQFFADAVSDPLGPPITDITTVGLFVCAPDGSNSAYCFPGDPPTTDPFGTGPTTQPPPTDPTPPINPPPDNWFGPPDYLPTNPVNPVDVSGDGTTSPIDSLLVINYLNAFDPGPDPLAPSQSAYLDATNDGFVSPIDALMVINDLNSAANSTVPAVAAAVLSSSPILAPANDALLALLALDAVTASQSPTNLRAQLAL
jgi:dockerin type I repeat protein/matrixin